MGSGGSLKSWESGAGEVIWWLKAPLCFSHLQIEPQYLSLDFYYSCYICGIQRLEYEFIKKPFASGF